MTNKEAISILERKTTIPGDGYTWEQIEEAINVAVAALKSNQVGSEPLTLEQLREMSGKPVWIERIEAPYDGKWFIVDYADTENPDKTLYTDSGVTYSEYGKYFIAHPYPPARIDREAWTAEREWFDEETGNPIDGIERVWGWKCSKCGKALPDDFDNPDYPPKIEFCPFCGRAMTPRAWAELEKRLRG